MLPEIWLQSPLRSRLPPGSRCKGRPVASGTGSQPLPDFRLLEHRRSLVLLCT